MITGPIASGKSSVASLVAEGARQRGLTVALTDLVGAWLARPVDLVVDEGTSTREEVDLVLDQVPRGARVTHVVLTADLEPSHARALVDPGRGVSRVHAFLQRDHERFATELPDLPCDLRLHVEGRAPRELAGEILGRVIESSREGCLS